MCVIGCIFSTYGYRWVWRNHDPTLKKATRHDDLFLCFFFCVCGSCFVINIIYICKWVLCWDVCAMWLSFPLMCYSPGSGPHMVFGGVSVCKEEATKWMNTFPYAQVFDSRFSFVSGFLVCFSRIFMSFTHCTHTHMRCYERNNANTWDLSWTPFKIDTFNCRHQ